MKEFISHSVEETLKIARNFALDLKMGDQIALTGELGSGKTHFAKGIITALTDQTQEAITSPTFTLIEEYPGKIPIYHLDLYRLNHAKELQELDQDILFGSSGITLIEWAERFPEIVNQCRYQVCIDKLSARERQIKITAFRQPSPE